MTNQTTRREGGWVMGKEINRGKAWVLGGVAMLSFHVAIGLWGYFGFGLPGAAAALSLAGILGLACAANKLKANQ